MTPLLPELRKLSESRTRRGTLRKLRAAFGRSSGAQAAAEAVEALALPPAELQRLVSFCGLAVGEDEDVDVRALAASARGELFFEDTGPAAAEQGLAHTALEQVREEKLGDLEGVEELRGVGGELVSPKKRRKKG